MEAYTCPDHLYVIRDEWTKALKVGRSADPESRVTQLQTGCPGTLSLVHVVPHGGFLESAIRAALEPFVLRGEWYGDASPITGFVEDGGDVVVPLHQAYRRLTAVFMEASLAIEGDGANKERRLRLREITYRMWGNRWVWLAEWFEKRAWETENGVSDDHEDEDEAFPLDRWIHASGGGQIVWYRKARWEDHQAEREIQVRHLSRVNKAFDAEEERRARLRAAGMASDPDMTTEQAVARLDSTDIAAD